MSDVGPVEGNCPGVGRHHAEDHAEGGGLTGPVSAEQTDDFFLGEDETHLIDNGSAAVRLDELGSFEKIHGASPARPAVRVWGRGMIRLSYREIKRISIVDNL